MKKLTAVVLWLALLGAPTACQTETGTVRPDVVLIVVDTLRADHLGCYGYWRNTSPQIDSLAEQSIRFERAYSTAPWTKPAVASMLTGLYPSRHGVDKMLHVLPQSATPLAELLRENGYQTAGVVSHSLLGEKFGFDQGFDRYDESQARGHHHVSTEEVARLATALIGELRADEKPYFLFVHLFDPHDTYRPHGVGFAAKRAGRVAAGQPSPRLRKLEPPLDTQEVQLLRDVYDEEIRFTDRGIGEILKALGDDGRSERTLIVLTSDHGEEFMERGWLGHGTSMFDEVLRVPLLIRLPGAERAGSVEGDPVSTAGVMATVLDVAGLPASARSGLDVGSLLGPRPRPNPVLGELSYAPRQWRELDESTEPWLRMLVDGEWKLISDRLSGQVALFDVVADPGETTDLASRMPDRAETLHAQMKMEDAVAAQRRLGRETTDLSAGQRESLRQLGYDSR